MKRIKFKSTLERIEFDKKDILFESVKERWKSSTQSRNRLKLFDHICSVEIDLEKDGALFLQQDDSQVYLYPDQVEHLKQLLKIQ